MIEFTQTTTVDAPVETVWDVLTDFSKYGEWNSYVTISQGAPMEGTAVELIFSPSDGSQRTEAGKLTGLEEQHCLRWEAVALYRCVYVSIFEMELDAVDESTTCVRVSRRYGGILARVIADQQIKTDLAELNKGLASQAISK